MLVVDASAVVAALVGRPAPDRLLARLAEDGDLHAPHLLDIEFLHALRRLNLEGRLSEDRAIDARTDFDGLAIIRYPHVHLADLIWHLRHNLTAYDAAYVALAEVLNAPLVTCDRALADPARHAARVELF